MASVEGDEFLRQGAGQVVVDREHQVIDRADTAMPKPRRSGRGDDRANNRRAKLIQPTLTTGPRPGAAPGRPDELARVQVGIGEHAAIAQGRSPLSAIRSNCSLMSPAPPASSGGWPFWQLPQGAP